MPSMLVTMSAKGIANDLFPFIHLHSQSWHFKDFPSKVWATNLASLLRYNTNSHPFQLIPRFTHTNNLKRCVIGASKVIEFPLKKLHIKSRAKQCCICLGDFGHIVDVWNCDVRSKAKPSLNFSVGGPAAVATQMQPLQIIQAPNGTLQPQALQMSGQSINGQPIYMKIDPN